MTENLGGNLLRYSDQESLSEAETFNLRTVQWKKTNYAKSRGINTLV